MNHAAADTSSRHDQRNRPRARMRVARPPLPAIAGTRPRHVLRSLAVRLVTRMTVTDDSCSPGRSVPRHAHVDPTVAGGTNAPGGRPRLRACSLTQPTHGTARFRAATSRPAITGSPRETDGSAPARSLRSRSTDSSRSRPEPTRPTTSASCSVASAIGHTEPATRRSDRSQRSSVTYRPPTPSHRRGDGHCAGGPRPGIHPRSASRPAARRTPCDTTQRRSTRRSVARTEQARTHVAHPSGRAGGREFDSPFGDRSVVRTVRADPAGFADRCFLKSAMRRYLLLSTPWGRLVGPPAARRSCADRVEVVLAGGNRSHGPRGGR